MIHLPPFLMQAFMALIRLARFMLLVWSMTCMAVTYVDELFPCA